MGVQGGCRPEVHRSGLWRRAKSSTSRPAGQAERISPRAIVHDAVRGGAGAGDVSCGAHEAAPHRPVGDTRDLRVGFTRQDDYDLDEMIGADSYFDELSVSDLQEFGQDDLLPVRRRSHAHHRKTAFTGIVRGSIRDLRHEGPWVRITELLSECLGTRSTRGVLPATGVSLVISGRTWSQRQP